MARWIGVAAVLVLAACSSDAGDATPTGAETVPEIVGATDDVSAAPHRFPTEVFAGLGDEPVSAELAAELQALLDEWGNASGGITATVISRHGTWSGATGIATPDRAMVPDDQMAIGSISKVVVAAQVMQLVEAGALSLDDAAADRLPPDLAFDTNGARIVDLLSHRSGIPDFFADADELLRAGAADPLHVWTPEEKLAVVPTERGEVGGLPSYRGINYLLLSLIVEHVTGQPLAQVLRGGVLAGDDFDRLITQPDERPSAPVAMPSAAPADTLETNGGYLPSLSVATLALGEGSNASDALSLARWFQALCAGRIVSQASIDAMTDFVQRPEIGLGLRDRREENGQRSGALGHPGLIEGYATEALCVPDPGVVVVVLRNSWVGGDPTVMARRLWQAAGS